MQQLNLICATETQIGSLGSAFFIGWTISSVLLPKLADQIGRKPVLLATYVILIPISIAVLVSKSLTFTIIMLFFLGMTASGTCTIVFVFTIEAIVPDWRPTAGSLFNVSAFSQCFLIGFYFKFISNQSVYILLFGLVLSVAAAVLMLVVVQESPLFLLKKGNFERANAVLNKIHLMNQT